MPGTSPGLSALCPHFPQCSSSMRNRLRASFRRSAEYRARHLKAGQAHESQRPGCIGHRLEGTHRRDYQQQSGCVELRLFPGLSISARHAAGKTDQLPAQPYGGCADQHHAVDAEIVLYIVHIMINGGHDHLRGGIQRSGQSERERQRGSKQQPYGISLLTKAVGSAQSHE